MTVDQQHRGSKWAGELSRADYSRLVRRPNARWLAYLAGMLLATSLLSAGTHPVVLRWLGRGTRDLGPEEALRILKTQKADDWAQQNSAYAIHDWIESACEALADKAREPDLGGLDAANYLGRIMENQLEKIVELSADPSSPHAEELRKSLEAIRRKLPPP